MPTIIIDPVSSEVNRGSFCYLPYLLYSALKYRSNAPTEDVILFEDFSIAQLDRVGKFPAGTLVYVGLWSYPQIETALAIWRLAPHLNLHYFGYEPLIEHLGLPLLHVTEEQIVKGMTDYPTALLQHQFKHVLLSDCDMHLRTEEHGRQVYPMFTSYGCPRKCAFCSASRNTGGERYELPVDVVIKNLAYMNNNGVRAIHFTDEDFFFDTNRAWRILENAYDMDRDWQFIALAHAHTFKKFYDRWVNLGKPHFAKCLKLAEIGLETADLSSAKAMGKHGTESEDIRQFLAKNDLCKILWLTMTFFPGDNITAQNKTGEFLKQYGLNPDELCARIATNGTEAGLGQFYQFYDGCGDYTTLNCCGRFLTSRPMRLLPSYLPMSFLQCRVKSNVNVDDKDSREVFRKWCGINCIESKIMAAVWHIDWDKEKYVGNVIDRQKGYIQKAQYAMAIAVLARLNFIAEAK